MEMGVQLINLKWHEFRNLLLIGLYSLTVFSRIEAAASINIFVKKSCFYVRPASINGIFCNNLGSLIWYHLCNLYARCHCLEINLLYQTGVYLLFSLSKLRLVLEGGFYSRKYGTQKLIVFSFLFLHVNQTLELMNWSNSRTKLHSHGC